MGRIKTFIIFPVAALYLPIVPGCKGPDGLVCDPMCFQMFLKESRLVPVSSKAVGKFRPIIRLDTLDGKGERFYEVLHKLCRRIRAVFLKGFYKTPSGILVYGGVLEELLSNDLAVFEAGGGDEFHIHLDTLSGILHLLIRLRDVFWIGRMDRHNALFPEETVETGDGAGITTLSELDPENDQTGIGVTAAHVPNQFDFLRGMLIGVAVRTSGAITQGLNGAVIATFPTIDVLPVGLVFDRSLSDAIFFSILNE